MYFHFNIFFKENEKVKRNKNTGFLGSMPLKFMIFFPIINLLQIMFFFGIK